MSIKNLYQGDILDHYENPKNRGLLTKFDFISPMYNPSCGDSVTMSGLIKDQIIEKVTFEGKGCVLSLAMASKLTEFAIGKSLQEIQSLDEQVVFDLLGMQLGPKRMQCGLLPLQALQKGVNLFLGYEK